MWVAFAVQKLLTKNIRILYIESAKTVNEMTLNELVKLTTLWTTGPWLLKMWYIKSGGVLVTTPQKMLCHENMPI